MKNLRTDAAPVIPRISRSQVPGEPMGKKLPLTTAFAPDYRTANPYQNLLAKSLEHLGVSVKFFSEYYTRYLPLSRDCFSYRPDVLHLHWPEHYFKFGGSLGRKVRRLRYPIDLGWAHSNRKLAVTAHNLTPHHSAGRPEPLMEQTFRAADIVFAHSDQAGNEIVELYRVPEEKIRVIPHGDLLATLPPLQEMGLAREELKLPSDDKLALAFGRVAPYKGLDELIEFWSRSRPEVRLLVVGDAADPDYRDHLSTLAQQSDGRVLLRLGRVPDEVLALYLSSADCAVFNYPNLLTSGSAALARSAGLPILFPARLHTVDLGEPSSRVFRFECLDSNFQELVERAAALSLDHDSAADWRAATHWDVVAGRTLEAYQSILE